MERLSEIRQSAPIPNQQFDEILEQKVKCGKFQYICTLTLGMLWLADGAEMQVLGFILPVVQKEWDIPDWKTNLLGSSVFLFWGIAAIISGKFSDLYGRRLPLLISMLGQAIFAFLSAFSKDYWQLLIFRSLFGLFLGIGNPLTATYMSEIVPREERGKYFGIVYNMFPLGEVVTIVIAYFCLSNLQSGQWRLLLVWTSFPGFVAFLLAYFYLRESPRYLLISQNNQNSKQQGYDLINFIGQQNHQQEYENLTDFETQRLSLWADEQKEAQDQYKGSYSQLFSKDYASLTYKTMVMWFSLAFVYYGIVFQLPTILFKIHEKNGKSIDQSNSSDFIGIILSALVEVPSNLFGLFMLERKGFGRKFTLSWSYVICAISCFFTYFHDSDDQLFFFFISTVKFFINISFLACYMFTSEIYPTSIRSTGIGLNNSVTRFGGVLMPWISLIFYVFGNTGPFLSCAIVSTFSAIAAFLIPSDTKNIILDTYIQLKDIKSKRQSKKDSA